MLTRGVSIVKLPKNMDVLRVLISMSSPWAKQVKVLDLSTDLFFDQKLPLKGQIKKML